MPAKTPEEKAAIKAEKDAKKAAEQAEKDAKSDISASGDAEEEIDSEATELGVEYINPQEGLTVRRFSLELHGEDFRAIAEQFCEKFNGRLVK